jgi:Reverse transcriptase (RNA-dependent DNA polymerase)/Retroviral aspartyl protease
MSSIVEPETNNIVVNDCFNSTTNGEKIHDILPITFVTIQSFTGQCPLLTLIDSGSSSTWVARRAIPPTTQLKQQAPLQGITLAGSLSMTSYLPEQKIWFIELRPTQVIQIPALPIFDQPDCPYNIIMGRDCLQRAGIEISFLSKSISMQEAVLAMRTRQEMHQMTTPKDLYLYMQDVLHDNFEDCYEAKYIKSDYKAADIQEIVNSQCQHLEKKQQEQLFQVLSQFPDLFSGRLRKYTKEIHVDVDTAIMPSFQRHYAIPHHNLAVFKAELDNLEGQDVIKQAEPSEWCAPSFAVPKPNGTMRMVTDFRKLNVAVKRQGFPMPLIPYLIRKYSRYTYMTKLDMIMQFYTFILNLSSRQYCTFSTPFGLYCYKRLPMGLKISPDVSQEAMETTLEGIPNANPYMDDVGIRSDTWEEHLEEIQLTLEALDKAGFSINPAKCEWGVQTTRWLGHVLTPEGIKPDPKKVEAILAMQPPTTLKQLRSFIGAVNYYRDMWPHRSGVMAPLTKLTSAPRFIWE